MVLMRIYKIRYLPHFFTTKGEFGTGLGLSQAFGFVERSGGTIKAISENNRGSEFILYFPRYEAHINDDINVSNTKELALGGNESILIVDDEEALLEFAKIFFDKYGYNVYAVESGEKALTILETEHIDLVLIDIIIPKMNGYELAVIVNERYPEVHIQLVSGFDDEKHIDLVDKKLHDTVIHKPYSIQTMLKSIRTLLDT